MLHFLRWKVSNLLEHGFRNIHIIDNNSSYVPLREYYFLSLRQQPMPAPPPPTTHAAAPAPKDLPAASADLFTLHRMPTNRGAYALWKVPGLVQSIDLVGKRFVLTDVDVIYPRFPHGFSWLPTFNALLDRFPGLVKVGHALELNDLEEKELGMERSHWAVRVGLHADNGTLKLTATPEESEVDLLADTSGAARAKRRARGLDTTTSTDNHFTVYAAALDTSGGLYRENCAVFHPWWVRGVRYSLRVAGKNFTAHHLPWYLDHENKDIWPPDYAAAMRDKLSISAGGGTYSARMPNDETESKKGTVRKT
eukprot:g11052.t1